LLLAPFQEHAHQGAASLRSWAPPWRAPACKGSCVLAQVGKHWPGTCRQIPAASRPCFDSAPGTGPVASVLLGTSWSCISRNCSIACPLTADAGNCGEVTVQGFAQRSALQLPAASTNSATAERMDTRPPVEAVEVCMQFPAASASPLPWRSPALWLPAPVRDVAPPRSSFGIGRKGPAPLPVAA